MIKPKSYGYLALAFALASVTTVRANVYATDPKLDGSSKTLITAQGNSTTISFLLSEPADLGGTVTIFSGTNVIREVPLPPFTNSVVWDGNDSNGVAVSLGSYSASITVASKGHTAWTQISSNSQPGAYVFDPEGIAVDNNTNSSYYGRVLIASASTGPHAATVPGDNDTILKLNANGTFADEGAYGNGNYANAGVQPGTFGDDGNSDIPQKLRMGRDDRLYMNDLIGGQVVAFDPALKSSEVVLSQNNYINNPFYPDPIAYQNDPTNGQYGWFSLDVTDADTTNGLIWLGDADVGDPNTTGAGVWFWHLTNGIADPNDTSGTQAITVGGSLSVAASGGLMVDTNLDIFVSQDLTSPEETNAVTLLFTNAIPTNLVETNAAWTSGAGGEALVGNRDTTIDSRQHPKYVACSLAGPTSSGVRILNPTNGVTLTNLDTADQYNVTAWDNVGNLYAASGSAHRWVVFSPPNGTNQATTPVIETIQVVLTSTILDISSVGTNIVIDFTGHAPSPSNFTLLSAPAVQGPYTATTTGVTIIETLPGFYTFTVPQNGAAGFYRIEQQITL